MKKKLNLSIPKPCHEDWQTMTPNQQGKFCGACAKTVVDFTKKSVKEIQSFFIENKGKKVCGRFQQKQLDTITIEIPEQALFQQVSFSKMFLLALLITMGATLMSCNSDGNKKKINQVIVLDSVVSPKVSEIKKIDSISKDSIIGNKKQINQEKIIPPEIVVFAPTTGEVVLGLPALEPEEVAKKDSIEIINEPILFGLIQESPPTFKDSNAKTNSEIKEEFNKKMVEFINTELDLKNIRKIVPAGKYRNYTTFKIDSLGRVTDIKTRAKYLIIETEINKVISQLPDFIPGTQRNKPVPIKFTMPITFLIE